MLINTRTAVHPICQSHADGEAAYRHTLRTNAVYGGADVKAYVLARVGGYETGVMVGSAQLRPQIQPLDAAKPLFPAQYRLDTPCR